MKFRPAKFPRHKKTLRELFAFIVVGIAATVTHFAVGLTLFYALPLGISALWANFMAFCVAYLVSYFGNAILVFPDTKLGPSSFFRFLTVSLASLGLNQAIIYVFTGILAWPYWQAMIVALMVVPPATYLALQYWGVRGAGSGQS